mgnify:CR=1 FL=1
MKLRVGMALIAGVGCGLLGMRRAALGMRREQELRAWLETLQKLQLLLQESAMPLPEVFRKSACTGSPQTVLMAIAEHMVQYPRETAAHAFDTLQNSGMNWMENGNESVECLPAWSTARWLCVVRRWRKQRNGYKGRCTRRKKKDGGMDGLRSRWDGQRALV